MSLKYPIAQLFIVSLPNLSQPKTNYCLTNVVCLEIETISAELINNVIQRKLEMDFGMKMLSTACSSVAIPENER